tara:strand:- start:636 stop:815 length:180 start_codon:yes stop_codon:yes gene_type:complete
MHIVKNVARRGKFGRFTTCAFLEKIDATLQTPQRKLTQLKTEEQNTLTGVNKSLTAEER